MRVRVKLFAILREQAGAAELLLDLSPGATVADAATAITEKLPMLRPHATRVAYAVNQSYAKANTLLSDGDELAIIPPVSGG